MRGGVVSLLSTLDGGDDLDFVVVVDGRCQLPRRELFVVEEHHHHGVDLTTRAQYEASQFWMTRGKRAECVPHRMGVYVDGTDSGDPVCEQRGQPHAHTHSAAISLSKTAHTRRLSSSKNSRVMNAGDEPLSAELGLSKTCDGRV